MDGLLVGRVGFASFVVIGSRVTFECRNHSRIFRHGTFEFFVSSVFLYAS